MRQMTKQECWWQLGDGKLDKGLGELLISEEFSEKEAAEIAPQIEEALKSFAGKSLWDSLAGYKLVSVGGEELYVYVSDGPMVGVTLPRRFNKKEEYLPFRTSDPKEIAGFKKLRIENHFEKRRESGRYISSDL